MHDAVLDYVSAAVEAHQLAGAVLDLGGRDVNGTPRHLFPDATRYVVVDQAEHPNVDVVADAADLTLDELFDVVVCTEVLEHAERAPDIVAAAFDHLVPGGCFVATMAGPTRAPHGMNGTPEPLAGEWYRNVSQDDLQQWLSVAGFVRWEIDELGRDVRCVAWRGGAR